MGKIQLLVLGLLVASAPVHAAKFQLADEMSNKTLESLVKTYTELTDVKAGVWETEDLIGHVTRVKITDMKSTQPWNKALKQMIYWLRAKMSGSDPFAMPEDVSVTKLSKAPRGLAKALDTMLLNGNVAAAEKVRPELQKALEEAVRRRPNAQLWISGDGNSFGNCNGVLVVDQTHSEVALLEVCYSE